jgi:hypothetical protein
MASPRPDSRGGVCDPIRGSTTRVVVSTRPPSAPTLRVTVPSRALCAIAGAAVSKIAPIAAHIVIMFMLSPPARASSMAGQHAARGRVAPRPRARRIGFAWGREPVICAASRAPPFPFMPVPVPQTLADISDRRPIAAPDRRTTLRMAALRMAGR